MKKNDISVFGKDHWFLLAYIETCCVETEPLDKRRLRCNEKRHPLHNVNYCKWDKTYGTRLKNLKTLPNHDDWDCLCDLENAELIETISEISGFVKLTKSGSFVVNQIRNHKINGGSFSNFQIKEKFIEKSKGKRSVTQSNS